MGTRAPLRQGTNLRGTVPCSHPPSAGLRRPCPGGGGNKGTPGRHAAHLILVGLRVPLAPWVGGAPAGILDRATQKQPRTVTSRQGASTPLRSHTRPPVGTRAAGKAPLRIDSPWAGSWPFSSCRSPTAAVTVCCTPSILALPSTKRAGPVRHVGGRTTRDRLPFRPRLGVYRWPWLALDPFIDLSARRSASGPAELGDTPSWVCGAPATPRPCWPVPVDLQPPTVATYYGLRHWQRRRRLVGLS